MFKLRYISALIAMICLPTFGMAESLKSPEFKVLVQLEDGVEIADDYHSKTGRILGRFALTRLDPPVTFSPPISRLLLMAGHNLIPSHDKEYFDTRVPKKHEFYHTTFLWKMQREFQKLRPERPLDYKESMVGIEKRLKSLIVTKRRARREYLRYRH
jgi:hypothetical protein